MKAKKSFVICHLSYVLKFFFFLFLFSFFLFSSCKRSTEPIYNPQTLQLTVADVSCTETWLKLKAQIAQKDSSDLKLQLYRDDSLIVNKPLTTADSVLYVDGLQPATSYAFTAKVLNGSELLAASAKTEATTMDTTSHNFTWQTFEFGGQGGSSCFYDVAIIDENDIWAVGEIYTADDKYNAAHWDGEKWELKKIYFYYQNNEFWGPIYSMFSFSKNDIWFGMGSLIHWNGFGFQSYKIPDKFFPSKANKIWGTSDHDLYVVGNNGLIVHYDGRQWTRIESGTDLPIQDIWGAFNKETNKYEILCVASNEYNNYGKKIIKIENKKTNFIQDKGLPWSLRSIWFISDKIYYVCGSGIYSKIKSMNRWYEIENNIQFYSKKIKGNQYNDIFVCGAFGLLTHYNGLHWYNYLNHEIYSFNGAYYSLDYKENLVVVVGEKLDQTINTKSIILIGRRK